VVHLELEFTDVRIKKGARNLIGIERRVYALDACRMPYEEKDIATVFIFYK